MDAQSGITGDFQYHLGTGDAAFYEIRVKGHLDTHWAEWFEGMTVFNLQNGETVLAGVVVDQANLHGLLGRVRDLNLTLIAVTRTEPAEEDAGGDHGA